MVDNRPRSVLIHWTGFFVAWFIILDPLKEFKYNLGMKPKKVLPPDIALYFAQQGSKGGKIGGKLRAESLTPERRKEIAQKAIAARWGKRNGNTA